MGTMPDPTDPLLDAIREALTHVLDPEIKRPITDLGMVRSSRSPARARRSAST